MTADAWGRTVARLMRLAHLKGVDRRGRFGCTKRDPQAEAADDLVQRDFTVTEPNRRWVADVTQHRAWDGWVYLSVVIDAFSRRVVGWSIADHLRAELVCDAFDMAVWLRKPAPGAIHHSRPRVSIHLVGLRHPATPGRDPRLDGFNR